MKDLPQLFNTQIEKPPGQTVIASEPALRPPAPQPNWFKALSTSERVRLLTWGVVAALLLLRLSGFLIHSFEVIGWPYQVDYDEGLNLSSAWHLSQGHNIYANSVPERFIAAPYPWLYFALNAVGIKLWGIQFQFGRLLSFGASVGIALLIGWCVWMVARRSQVRRLDAGGAALVSGLLWFVPTPVYIWSTFFKQDMVAIAIALLSIALVYRWQDHKWLWWTAPLMALAFFAKQNELAATGVGCGYMIVHNWRRGSKLTLLTIFCIAVPFLAFNLLTKNGYYNHTIGYQLVPWKLNDLTRHLGQVVRDHWVLVGLGGVYLLGCFGWLARAVWLARGRERWVAFHHIIGGWLFPLYLAAGAFSLLTLGAYQGNYNLTLDLFPPLLIGVGTVLALLARSVERLPQSRRRTLLGSVGLLVGGLLVWQALTTASPETYFDWGSMPSQVRREMVKDLQKQIAIAPGDLLTDDMYLALSAGRNVPYDNLYHMRVESQSGKWDDSKFLQDLRDRRFGLILLEHETRRWSEVGWQTLNDNYELIFPDGIDLWRPRARPTVPQYRLPDCSLAEVRNGLGQTTLTGWSIRPGNLPLKAGDNLVLTTYWEAGTPFARNYTLFVHLEDANGRVLAQRDDLPATTEGQARPLTGWSGPKPLQIDQSFVLPSNLPPGQYRLTLGGYRQEGSGLQPLQPTCATTNGSAIILGNLKVSG